MKKPNILLITSDQHRADTLGCAGHPSVRTPHLDQLAFSGARFTNATSTCPVCIPARTTWITGIPAHIYGSPAYNDSFRIDCPEENFMGSIIGRTGYDTALIGKTHWHTDEDFDGGFDHFVPLSELAAARDEWSGGRGNLTGLGGNEIVPSLSYWPPELSSCDWLIDRSIDWLDDRDSDKPFFLWTSMIDPHPPFTVHEPFYSMYRGSAMPEPLSAHWADDENSPWCFHRARHRYNAGRMKPDLLRHAREVYCGMVTNMDFQLGRLFGKLMASGEWDNTVVIYLSDHGEFLGDFGAVAKTSFLNSACNVPLIVRLPDWLQPDKGLESGALVANEDLLPTLCELAGAELPEAAAGRSLVQVAQGKTETVREALHGNIEGSHLWFSRDWKYLYFAEDGTELLFNLKDDPDELNNLAQSEPKKCAEMRAELIAELERVNHPHLVDGQLLNEHKQKRPVKELLAENPLGWGCTVLAAC